MRKSSTVSIVVVVSKPLKKKKIENCCECLIVISSNVVRFMRLKNSCTALVWLIRGSMPRDEIEMAVSILA